MTRFLSTAVRLLVGLIASMLPRWKRATFLARLYDSLHTTESVTVNGRALAISIPDRTSIYWVRDAPNSEPVTNAWIASLTGKDVLVDVGANVGFFSLMAAAYGVSRVHAIEPNPFSYAALCRNIVTNGFQDVISPIGLAVTKDLRTVDFSMSGTSVGSIDNHIEQGGGQTGLHLSLIAMSLDFMTSNDLMPNVSHIKIDIDGLELDVLTGSNGLLAMDSMKSVLVEDDGDLDKVTERDALMHAHGFERTDAFGTMDNYTVFQKSQGTPSP